MNLKAKYDPVRGEEITFPNHSLRILTKSSVQTVQFSPQGTLIALGCKPHHILIADYATMGILRYFNLHDDYNLETNQDVDQFHHFWRNTHVLDDDFVFKQKLAESYKDNESFLEEKYKERVRQSGGAYKPPRTFQIDGSKEGKSSFVSAKSSVISTIDWSVDSRYMVANFKIAGQVVVWDIITCQRVY